MVFDIQGWITLVIGGLLALITLFSSYTCLYRREIEFEKRRIAHEQRMRQLDDEDAAFNARMQVLAAKLAALWPSSN